MVRKSCSRRGAGNESKSWSQREIVAPSAVLWPLLDGIALLPLVPSRLLAHDPQPSLSLCSRYIISRFWSLESPDSSCKPVFASLLPCLPPITPLLSPFCFHAVSKRPPHAFPLLFLMSTIPLLSFRHAQPGSCTCLCITSSPRCPVVMLPTHTCVSFLPLSSPLTKSPA